MFVFVLVGDRKATFVPVIVSEAFFVTGFVEAAFVALNVIGNDLTEISGLPVIVAVPFEASQVNVKPKSSRSSMLYFLLSESEIEYVISIGKLPVAEILLPVYAEFTLPLASLAVNFGATPLTLSVNSVSVVPASFVALTVRLYVPASFGVPDIVAVVPVVFLVTLKSLGNPEISQVIGVVPVADSLAVYFFPSVASDNFVVVIVGTCKILMETFALALPSLFEAFSVIV